MLRHQHNKQANAWLFFHYYCFLIDMAGGGHRRRRAISCAFLSLPPAKNYLFCVVAATTSSYCSLVISSKLTRYCWSVEFPPHHLLSSVIHRTSGNSLITSSYKTCVTYEPPQLAYPQQSYRLLENLSFLLNFPGIHY
jgi:hypothetical protein